MTRRILPHDEWPKLAGTALEAVWPLLPPERTSILVVEDEETIIGCWAFLWALHAEGVWVHPAHQGKSAVARHLLHGLKDVAGSLGAGAVVTSAVDPGVAAMLEQLGAEPFPQSYTLAVAKGVH